MPHILGNNDTLGGTRSNIYHRRAEDISIKFNPTFNGQRANEFTKFFGTDGTIKPQYVTVDNGLETDHKAAMSLHLWQWQQSFDILHADRTGHEVNSHVTILNPQITMHVATDNDD
eukprot:4907493-Amphidinium_carterae.1